MTTWHQWDEDDGESTFIADTDNAAEAAAIRAREIDQDVGRPIWIDKDVFAADYWRGTIYVIWK